MKKHEAIALFGTTRELAAALGITRHAIYQWPDDLPQDQADRVIGAAVRLRKSIDTHDSASRGRRATDPPQP